MSVKSKHGGSLPVFSSSAAATVAEKDGVPVFKFPRWRVKGQAIPEVVDRYKATGAELNVLPFCSQFIPMEVIDYPKHGSIIYHPSLLPRHRGASAINWSVTLMLELKGISGSDPTSAWLSLTGPSSTETRREASRCSGLTMDLILDRFCCRESVTLNLMTRSTQSTRDFSSQRASKAWWVTEVSRRVHPVFGTLVNVWCQWAVLHRGQECPVPI